MITPEIAQLRQWIEECPPGKMVFLGGAGMSTESGIPDFRSPTGLYGQPYDYPYPPEVMISHSFFVSYPKLFYDFYCSRMLFLDAKPNKAHYKLAELEHSGTLAGVITQNIDGLHQAAGSQKVLELHGSVWRNYCVHCGHFMDVYHLIDAHNESPDGIPYCPICGNIVKPDVVLYEEPLNGTLLQESIEIISQSELMVIAGTSLAVYPAAGLLEYFTGPHLVIVNLAPTPQDKRANLVINAPAGEVFDF